MVRIFRRHLAGVPIFGRVSEVIFASLDIGCDLGPICQFKEFLRGSKAGCQYR